MRKTIASLFLTASLLGCHNPPPEGGDLAVPPGGDLAVPPGGDLAVPPGPDGGPGADMPHGGGAIKTVFMVVMENHNWSAIKGSASAPYINKMLLPMAAHAENYKGAKGGLIHPSEPNYIWLEAGDNLGIITDDPPAEHHQSTPQHLVTLLENAHLDWRSYQEDITDGTCPLTAVKEYAPKHNPMVFFDDVINYHNGMADPMAPRCLAHVKPLTQLATDLSMNTVARYNFITPNLCHDMHDSCAPTNDDTRQGDDWLSQWVPQIMASDAYKNGGALFITWDESEIAKDCLLADCPIGMIVVSPLGKGGGYSNMIAYDHSSTLKSLQEIFGVTPLLRHAGDAGVNDLRDLFTTFP